MTTDHARSDLHPALAALLAMALGAAGCGHQIRLPIAADDLSSATEQQATAPPPARATTPPATPDQQPEPAVPDSLRELAAPGGHEDHEQQPDRVDGPDSADGVVAAAGGSALAEAGALAPGDSGETVEALQLRLSDLGYWTGPIDGRYGDLTEQAVMAFQGWEGLARDGRASAETIAALDAAAAPVPASTSAGIEVHLDQQVLLVVDGGGTEVALHVSTGSGQRYTQPSGHEAVADTPRGSWEISWRIDGERQSDLGRLWRPAYFHERGIAVHGYPEVPAEPASHGCVRVSMAAMDMLWAEGHVERETPVVVS